MTDAMPTAVMDAVPVLASIAPRKAASRSGSETRQRNAPITFRATDAERAEIEAAAERAGLTASSYVRAQALAEPKTRGARRPPVERVQLAQLIGQIGKLGSNLNQIARNQNRGHEDLLSAEVFAKALAELGEMKAALMAALGRAAR